MTEMTLYNQLRLMSNKSICIQFISTRKKILGLRTVNSIAIQPFKFVHSVSSRSYAGLGLVLFSFLGVKTRGQD